MEVTARAARGLHRKSGQCLHKFDGESPGTRQVRCSGFQKTEDSC